MCRTSALTNAPTTNSSPQPHKCAPLLPQPLHGTPHAARPAPPTGCRAEGHVGVWPQDGQHSLLAVPTGELIADHGVAVEAKADVGLLRQLAAAAAAAAASADQRHLRGGGVGVRWVRWVRVSGAGEGRV